MLLLFDADAVVAESLSARQLICVHGAEMPASTCICTYTYIVELRNFEIELSTLEIIK